MVCHSTLEKCMAVSHMHDAPRGSCCGSVCFQLFLASQCDSTSHVYLCLSLSLYFTHYILLLITLPCFLNMLCFFFLFALFSLSFSFHSRLFTSHFLSSLLCLSLFFAHFHPSPHFLPTSTSPPHPPTPTPHLLLPCLPSLLSFSDSTPCSLHVYFWSLSSSPHASITSPWFSLSVSLSSSLLSLSLLRFLLFPNLSHPHVHVCTRAPTQPYTCTHTDTQF